MYVYITVSSNLKSSFFYISGKISGYLYSC